MLRLQTPTVGQREMARAPHDFHSPWIERRTLAGCVRIAGRCAAAILFLTLLAGCHARRPGAGSSDARRPAHPLSSAAPPFTNGIHFRDVAAAAGVSYRWTPHRHPLTIGDSMGCGCAFFDFDNDGWQDILLVASPTVRLYHNLHNGHFEDVTHRVGLESVRGDWRGVAVGDFDGDGRLGLLLTGYHRLALLKNIDGKRFVDVTTTAGLDPSNRGHWGSSAGFMDLDGDGWLDLVLLNYVDFGRRDRQYCTPRPGIRIGCPPKTYRAELPELWKNLGNGLFRNVTAASGLRSAHGNGLTLAFCGLEGGGRGRVDFYIGNDTLPADLMINDGHGHFKNIGAESGVSRGMMSQPVAAMGADWGDYDRDGRFDLVVPDFSDELYELFHNLGSQVFEDTGPAMGLVKATYGRLGFGVKWIDMDNDGWPDLAIANGHVYDNPSPVTASATFREPLSVLRNSAGKQLIDITPRLDPSMQRTLVGRGLATGDFDNDGRVDFLVVDAEGPALLARNTSTGNAHWVTLDLRGHAPNFFAYGAQVTARAGTRQWVGQVAPASSYLSSSDPRVHFGLGPVQRLESLTVVWPDGLTETLRGVPADRFVRIEEGRGIRSVAAGAHPKT